MFRPAFFAVAAICALGVSSARAETVVSSGSTPEIQSRNVDISQIDLTSSRNWNTVTDRVYRAAQDVCERMVQPSDRYSADIEACTDDAYTNAVKQMRVVLARQQSAQEQRVATTAATDMTRHNRA